MRFARPIASSLATSDQNRALLKVISETKPKSMADLAASTDGQPGDISRTLKTMARYGLVDLRRESAHLRPTAQANS